MAETDELRRLLDERGIEYEQSYIEGIASYTHVTKWKTQAGNKRAFYEIEDGHPPYFTWMLIEMPTAAQAVAATVGRDTCHNVAPEFIEFRCSACGYNEGSLRGNHDASTWSYCPNCGRKVSE